MAMSVAHRTLSVMQSLVLYLLCISVPTVLGNLSPQFEDFHESSPLWVQENTTVGSVIGKLKARDLDSPTLFFEVIGDVAKQIVSLDRVSPKEMNIVLRSQLDREVVPDYSIVYQVRDEDNEVRKQGFLYVLDVNDNPPTFINLPYRAEIPEDAKLGDFVYKVSASDPDLGHAGLVNYNITTPQGMFSMNIADGTVLLAGALDYESERFYQLEVMALDGGTAPLNSTTDLIINVMDIQDTSPYFTNLPYIESIHENTTVGTMVLKLSAFDGDRGVPNAISYSFVDDGSADTSYFNIDSALGEISVAVPLDREDPAVLAKSGVMEFTVRAEEVTDTPLGPTVTTAPVTIHILDVNDQTPTFSQALYFATVLENTQGRIPVTMQPDGTELTVSDFDEAMNGRFALVLQTQANTPFTVFEPYPSTVVNEANVLLRVLDSSALDYETVTSFTFYIVARETETPERRTSRALVTVSLEDVNDNWPVFDSPKYVQHIEENPFNNTPVIQVSAVDADSGMWADITYSLRGASADLFRVDPTSGMIAVNVDADLDHSLLDREKQEVLFLTAEAQDGGGLRSSVQLEIHLDDKNDNAPSILREQYDGYVSENAQQLERPVVIEAIDLDQGPFNNMLIYSIVGGNPYNNFTINRDNGSLSLNRFPLDYESMEPALNGVFELTVEARDAGSPSQSSTTRVIIYVQDENDEIPFFLAPVYPATLPENTTQGTNVTQVSAIDKDGTSPNNEIIYRIESGAQDNFRIAADTGLVTVEFGAKFDVDVYGPFYSLRVLAIDKGTPSLTGTVYVDVTITDVNNKRPIFLNNPLSVEVSESKDVGELVLMYTAFDPDQSALLKYSILDQVSGVDEGGAPVTDLAYLRKLFEIDVDSGEVYVNNTLDREIVEKVTLEILAEDVNAEMPDPIQTATGTVTITLGDVNDNPPLFTPTNVYHASLSEASKPGVEVTRVTAVDLDKGDDLIRYDLVYDSQESFAFQISDADRNLGVITLLEAVNREDNQFINLTVLATDSGVPPLNSSCVVHIEIEDINDNSPEWEMLNETVYVWENTSAHTEIAYVYATDLDTGPFGAVKYFIISGSQGMFSLANQSGILSVAADLDREVTSQYRLTLEARDNNLAPASEQRKTPGYMNIIIVDVNDNIPQFDRPSYSGVVQENIQVNTPVTAVSATDPDIGNNGLVKYLSNSTAGNVSGFFDVNYDSGQVYVSGSLQGRHGDYVMVVVATDLGEPPQQNSTVVYIEVEDVNDHAPVIYQPQVNETIYIRENRPVGTLMVEVRATDRDKGQNGVVHYKLTESGTIEDWQKFHINSTTGDITNAFLLDREQQEVYTLEVVAYDLGTPRYDDRRTLRVFLLDEDDNPPLFDRDLIPVPYPVYVTEEVSNVFVADLGLAADPDSGNNSVICYFIVGGTDGYRSQFFINKTSAALQLHSKLDREDIPIVTLVVKATDVCVTHPGLGIPWNASDASLLLVDVIVQDINDNPPAFTKLWFTAGVTKDTQHGTEVLHLKDYSYDPDKGVNADMIYTIKPPFRMSGDLKGGFDKDPFIVGRHDGIIYTDVYFQEDMQGYIEFEIHVNDSVPGHYDSANVSVYLLHQDQRVKVVLLGTSDEVGGFKDIFASFLSNITGAIINVDMIRTHKDSNGDSDPSKTDMFIHGIYPQTGEVMEADVLIDIIDSNYEHLVDLFKEYNVIRVEPAVESVTSSKADNLQMALIITAVILGLLFIIIVTSFCLWRRKYKRKLKAATAMTYAVPGNGLNKLEMPGTNVHAYEGSNPIWLEQYEAQWPKEPDHDTDSKNSIDENALELPPQHHHVDEQEMSMDMYNDEYDHYNKIPNSDPPPDAYLQAALRDHQRGSNNLNSVGRQHSPARKSNGSASNGMPRNVGYDNVGYVQGGGTSYQDDDLEATEI